MYVSRVELHNIRGFSGKRAVDLELRPAGGWTVLAGRNGSGKTTLLQAIALALTGPSVARTLVPEFDGWVSGSARGAGRVQVDLFRDAAVDVFTGSGAAPKGDMTMGLVWRKPPVRDEHFEQRPIMNSIGQKHRGPERGPWAENPRGWFCAGYGPFRRLVGGSGEAQRLMLASGPAGRMATLFHEDASLAEGVSWLVDLHLRRLEKRPGAGRLLALVTGLLSDGLLPDGFRVTKVDSEGLWVARHDSEQGYPLREMSDGYRTVAALVLDMVRHLYATYGRLDARATDGGGVVFHAPGVVLIDEVDAHLHVTWQRHIGGWLRRHFPNIQFIVSSHSPYICQAADPGGLIRLPGPDERRAPQVVDEELYQRVVYGTGDDAALSALFGLETPYSDRAERERQRLVGLERRVYAGTASEAEAEEYGRLSELLSSSLETRVAEVAARLGGDR